MQNRGIISVCMRLSHLSEKFIGTNGATMQIVPPLCTDFCAMPGTLFKQMLMKRKQRFHYGVENSSTYLGQASGARRIGRVCAEEDRGIFSAVKFHCTFTSHPSLS